MSAAPLLQSIGNRSAEFNDQLRRAEMVAQLSPLRAMQQVASTHWRAAAWMLERAYPKRFARRDPAAFNSRQARKLMKDVLGISSVGSGFVPNNNYIQLSVAINITNRGETVGNLACRYHRYHIISCCTIKVINYYLVNSISSSQFQAGCR